MVNATGKGKETRKRQMLRERRRQRKYEKVIIVMLENLYLKANEMKECVRP